MSSVYGFSAERLDGTPLALDTFRGKVLLIANTASRCGFTPQYAELETLYRTYREQGFEVLAFPCNQFRQQEPGNGEQIRQFCETNYQISFPLFARIDVNGMHAHPLFRYLKQQAPGVLGSQAIKWNFTKFLVNRDGGVYRRYAPWTRPQSIAADIEQLLSAAA